MNLTTAIHVSVSIKGYLPLLEPETDDWNWCVFTDNIDPTEDCAIQLNFLFTERFLLAMVVKVTNIVRAV